MARQGGDLAALLPDDVLADVLRRVAPRGLAACRCACRAWRALIDGRRLLRADLLPRSLAGLFLCYAILEHPELLARPAVDAAGYTMPAEVEDHCNGLVLEWQCVLNPATGARACLPERPLPLLDKEYFIDEDYLAFDPTESPHYQVLLVPMVLGHSRLVARKKDPDPAYRAILQSEWPPSPFVLSVFSSRTGRWEERPLLREGEAAGTVADMEDHGSPHHSVCWRGALYVHRQSDFVMRISLSDDTYRVIKPPLEIEVLRGRNLVHLGRSQKGVYFAVIAERHLWVWILDDSGDRMDWILRHRGGFGLAFPAPKCNKETYGPWILQDNNNFDGDSILPNDSDGGKGGNNDDLVEQESEWDSDDENILDTEDRIQEQLQLGFEILGFHPYKEIVFLYRPSYRGFAYHLKTSKLEDLGDLYPKNYTPNAGHCGYVKNAFPYTPCWMGELEEFSVEK